MGFLTLFCLPWYMFENFHNKIQKVSSSVSLKKTEWGGAVGGVIDKTRWPSVGNC